MNRTASKQRNEFKRFLDGYLALRASLINDNGITALRPEHLKQFLDEFGRLHARTERIEEKTALDLKSKFTHFISEFSNVIENWRKRQKASADDFNIMEVLELESDELSHSKLLVWLLNANPRLSGTHYQGHCGLQAFLEVLLPKLEPSYVPNDGYAVEREVSYEKARLDIQVLAAGHFLIGIETKIEANERENQTTDEWDGMVKRAEREKIPLSNLHGFFLTPKGIEPKCDKFKPVTWMSIAKVFDIFAVKAEPDDVKLFARHCAKIFRILNPRLTEIHEEPKHGKITV